LAVPLAAAPRETHLLSMNWVICGHTEHVAFIHSSLKIYARLRQWPWLDLLTSTNRCVNKWIIHIRKGWKKWISRVSNAIIYGLLFYNTWDIYPYVRPRTIDTRTWRNPISELSWELVGVNGLSSTSCLRKHWRHTLNSQLYGSLRSLWSYNLIYFWHFQTPPWSGCPIVLFDNLTDQRLLKDLKTVWLSHGHLHTSNSTQKWSA
jgi:hypothetical protein